MGVLLRKYFILCRLTSFLASPLLLILRLYWGWQFFLTGKGKLSHIDNVVEFFQSLHIPFPILNAYLVGSIECVGGLCLMAGLLSRLVAIPLSVTLIVAYLTAHIESVRHLFTDPQEFISQDPFLFLLTLLLVLAFGPGRFSIDTLIERRFDSSSA